MEGDIEKDGMGARRRCPVLRTREGVNPEMIYGFWSCKEGFTGI